MVASRWFLYYLTYIDDARSNTNQVKLTYALFCCAICRGIANSQVLFAVLRQIAYKLVFDLPRTYLSPLRNRLVLINSSFKIVDSDGLDLQYFRQEVCHINRIQNSKH